MALRIVDLTKVGDGCEPAMTGEEWSEELAKPRAERKGLRPMPVEMTMTAGDERRLIESARRHHETGISAMARAIANGRDSNCL